MRLKVAYTLAAVPERVTSPISWLITKALRASMARIDSSIGGGLVCSSTRPRLSVMRVISIGLTR